MELTAYQQEMLDGVWGKGKSMAMQVLVGIGKCCLLFKHLFLYLLIFFVPIIV